MTHSAVPYVHMRTAPTYGAVCKVDARNTRSKMPLNLTHAISRDKFQPCHWSLLAYVAFLALHALHCMWLETALNAVCQLREDFEWTKY